MPIRSHHAPTAALLRNYMTSGRSDTKPVLWVYGRAAEPRRTSSAEKVSSEKGYFAGDPQGRSEREIESELEETFERRFHDLLPTLESPIFPVIDDYKAEICGSYVANIFLRSKPLREAGRKQLRTVFELVIAKADEPLYVRQYAAALNLRTGRSISVDALQIALKRLPVDDNNLLDRMFFTTATTSFSGLPEILGRAFWTLCEAPTRNLLQSDCAVAMLSRSPLKLNPTTYGSGIGRLGSEWYLVISPAKCLRVSLTSQHRGVLSPQEVNEINEYMIRAAHRNVYSNQWDLGLKKAVDDGIGTLRFFEDLIEMKPENSVIDYLASF